MKITYFLLSMLLFSQIVNSQNSFTAKLDVPKEMVQGEYSEITLNIYKPKGARNFTVFTQKLPKGFFVNMKDAMGATYTYENGTLTLTWLRCPEQIKFSVKYEIASMVGVEGKFDLQGKLTYMAGSQKATFNLRAKSFKLVKELSKNNISENANINIRYTNTKLKGVICKRQVVFNKKSDFYEIQVSLKSNKKGAYSIVESIPKGFDFFELESQDAKIRKKSNLVQYMWTDLSNENDFKIKYKLVPKINKSKIPFIEGRLSFLSEGKIYNLTITNLKKN